VEYVPIVFAEYGFDRLDEVFELDDVQFVYLAEHADSLYRYRRARQWPGFADKDAVEATVNASPKLKADTDYTAAWYAEQCELKGIKGPHHG